MFLFTYIVFSNIFKVIVLCFSVLLQCISSCSQSDCTAKQKSDILQSEEGKEEDCKIGHRKVHEAALWTLDQTQGLFYH